MSAKLIVQRGDQNTEWPKEVGDAFIRFCFKTTSWSLKLARFFRAAFSAFGTKTRSSTKENAEIIPMA